MMQPMPRLQAKGFATPDEVRSFPKGLAEVVKLDESAVGRAVYEPGWRWTTSMPAIAGTATCQMHHLGYAISGVMHVVLDDGQELDITGESVYEIPPGHDAWVVGDAPWVTVEWTSARTFGITHEGPGERVLATVLFTDIVDSTATLQRIGDTAWRDLLLTHNRILRDHLNTFRGREVTTTGDGFLAVFDGATRAVRCGAAMARSARTIGLPIRVGVHTGEVEFVGPDARGLAVHAAARVMSLAGPDEVLVSSTTHDLLEGSGLTLEDAGTHVLKGLPGERSVFRLVEPPR
jgi:class 3 adenylate cyclase